jgi:hypothetical protein
MMRKFALLLAAAVAYPTLLIAQAPPPAAPAAPAAATGYTPPPVSTTYRPLTGKLFFTDAERDRLDKARKDGVQIVDGEVVARAPRVEGFVQSSGGRTTYWVDGGQRITAAPSKNLAAAATMTGAEPAVTFRESGARAASTSPTKASPPKNKRPPMPGTAGGRNP